MKSVKKVKKKLNIIQTQKNQAFYIGDDINYRLYLKMEKFIKWILDDDIDLRFSKSKKPKRGERIRTDGKK